MAHLTLQQVDRDGAVRETLDAVNGDSRADFFRKAFTAGGAMVGGGAVLGGLAAPASAQSATDVNILNFALVLEFLEAEFYTEAENSGALRGRTAEFAEVVGAHERAHVEALRGVLGNAAVKKPRFDFQGTTEAQGAFRETAQLLEDTGVAAYKGQAPRIESDEVLRSALGIHSVEARHAAWIRHINETEPASAAFDEPMSMEQVLAAVQQTGFITSPLMTASGEPAFTG